MMHSCLPAGLLLLGFAGQGYAAVAATSTVAPTKTKTTCPQWYTTKVSPSPTNFACSVQGHLSKPALIQDLCYDSTLPPLFRGEPDCYRSCSNTPGCVSYGWDKYEKLCHVYSKPLSVMGLRHTNDTSLFYSNLRGCYVCNQDPVPVRPQCPDQSQLKPEEERKGFICGQNGFNRIPGSVLSYEDSIFAGPESCYQLCLAMDRYGLCKSYQYQNMNYPYTCEIFAETLKEKQWQADPNGASSFNLRGCYECDLPPAKVSTSSSMYCTATEIPVAPVLSNGDFQQTYYNEFYKRTEPTEWGFIYVENAVSLSRPNGNKFVELTTDGVVTTMYASNYGFNLNPYEPGTIYNLTFDLAVVNYTVPAQSTYEYCTLDYGNFLTNAPIDLSSKQYARRWRRVGPHPVNQSSIAGIAFQLTCNPARDIGDQDDPSVNVTAWLDNVSWSQNGKIVAGVNVGKPQP